MRKLSRRSSRVGLGSLGYLKYEGKLVEDGIIDAKAASKALGGLDVALRYFIAQERPDLAEAQLPIPVRIEEGSWIADIPEHAGALIKAGFGLVAFAYLKKAAEKMSENDFSDVGISTVLSRSLQGLQWLIEVAKHIGTTNIRRATLRGDRQGFIGYVNDGGVALYIPDRYAKPLANAPVTLLGELASVVEKERTLTVGVKTSSGFKEVHIFRDERAIFSDDEVDNEVIFPELEHGQYVRLEGVVTRGNEMSNTIGFWYNGRILTCRPKRGNIVRFKKQLFANCVIAGEITRLDKKGKPTEYRPKIIFDSLRIRVKRAQIPFPFMADDDGD